MNKRKFLWQAMLLSAGAYIVPSMLLSACKSESKKGKVIKKTTVATRTFKLPELTYGYNAFPETIDSLTMEIHYTKHHQGYTDKLNAALKDANISGKTIEEILSMDHLPDAIRNSGGGYFNHSLYRDILTPGGTMSNSFKAKIIKDFESEDAFMNELSELGATRFGSGWVWLV
jgi:Fe-Mn family superoxide dismutase